MPNLAARRLRADVAVVGGGIVGSSAALFLRRQGLSVVLLERDVCGAQASGVNHGGVRVQGRSPAQLPLALRAREIWRRLPRLVGTDGEYVESGHLKLARTDADVAALAAYARRVHGRGLQLELMSDATLRARFPWLGTSAVGGSWCPGDGHANPRLVSSAFARAARAAGANIVEHCDVAELHHDGAAFALGDERGLEVRATWLLNCAGAWALTVAHAFGDDAPMGVIHPSMAVTEPLPPFMDVNIGVEGGDVFARQTARGNCVVGGGQGTGRGSRHARPRADAIVALCGRVIDLLPRLAHAHVIRFWSGVEGVLPDNEPVIGPSAHRSQLLHAFGFCGHGFQTGPAVGEALAHWVAHGRPTVELEPFSIRRFAAIRSAR